MNDGPILAREAAITGRREIRVSPWVRLVEKTVEFARGAQPETYHCLAQADYVAILAQTPDSLIPIVRQYRPAVEAYTWELPAGLVDPGEDPTDTCRRELREETGLEAREIIRLGSHFPDTGRLENLLHAYSVRTSDPDPKFVPEPGVEAILETQRELQERIGRGEFRHLPHLAILLLARRHLRWD